MIKTRSEMDKLQDKLLPAMILALVAVAFIAGMFYGKLKVYEGNGAKVAGTQAGNQGAQPSGQAEEPPISVANLKVMAKNIGLNEKQFNSCLDEGKFEQKVKDSLAEAQELGVSGTPTFFINKLFFSGAFSQSIYEQIIERELSGGDWRKPPESLAFLFDGNSNNGEIQIKDEPELGKGYSKGEKEAAIKMVEFSDFECPYCARVLAALNSLLEKYSDQMYFEYRNFPLTGHPNAQKAAEAAECAGEQDKFWEMHDAIFQAQSS
jgi:protein-disulfide isomerase